MTFLPQKGPELKKKKKKPELSDEIYFKKLVLNKGLFKAEGFVNLSACEHSAPQSPTAGRTYGAAVPPLIEDY